jgi:alginate O-acetyltransferase complex protein AlgI
MVFNSDIFLFGFLPIVYFLFWILRSKRSRYLLLGAAGYVFYGWWNWRFCFLLLFSSLVSYFTGIAVDSSPDRRTAKRWVTMAVTVDLALLGFFKYYNFFAGNLPSSLALPVLNIVLPVGISFYTFHTISYVIDIYQCRVKATRNLPEYLTYVNLFSQLVAGPIVRFRQIEADLEAIDGPPREDWTARGIGFFLVGLIKKVVIADHLATIVDPILQHSAVMSFSDSWIAALGYTGQLYFDFSGYSDMAIGLGYLFALRIPQNFDAPYRSAGISDFWRRWHMSLSSWLRDYLYFSLGGNRKGVTRTYVNLMITMLLGGLWHGANWTFVIWGGYHGVLLIADRLAGRFYQKIPRFLYQAQTFFLVVVGWVFFRADNLKMALAWLHQMFLPASFRGGIDLRTIAWFTAAYAWAFLLPETWYLPFGTTRKWAPVYAFAAIAAYFVMNGKETPFLYFQF